MEQIGITIVYALLGLGVFMLALIIMEILTKFSLRKKVAEEGNIAVAIVLAAVIASLGMIISAAIQ